MKILTTLYNLKYLNKILSLADGILMGNDAFGTRLTKSFSVSEISKALAITHSLGKEAFLVANQIFTDQKLKQFKVFLNTLQVDKLTGIIVADLGAYQILDTMGLSKKVVYNPETLLTNTYDFNFLAKQGILGAYVAKELILTDILAIGKQKKYQMVIVGHGHLSMFYSKRQLIDNYTSFNKIENKYHNQQNLKLVEEHRSHSPYPILEDNAGTHVFRSQVSNSFNHLSELSEVIDYFVIDTIFKDDDYALMVNKMYMNAKLDQATKLDIEKQYHETWDDGFYHIKTIYQQKGNNND